MKLLKAGSIVDVELEEGATLADALKAAEMKYDSDAVYRTANSTLDGPSAHVSNVDVLVVAIPEDNGCVLL